ncbi:MAG: hypothetical protein AAF571_04275 [Verrucomicrobiota bacterium]
MSPPFGLPTALLLSAWIWVFTLAWLSLNPRHKVFRLSCITAGFLGAYMLIRIGLTMELLVETVSSDVFHEEIAIPPPAEIAPPYQNRYVIELSAGRLLSRNGSTLTIEEVSSEIEALKISEVHIRATHNILTKDVKWLIKECSSAGAMSVIYSSQRKE